jgi:hypothetical protein
MRLAQFIPTVFPAGIARATLERDAASPVGRTLWTDVRFEGLDLLRFVSVCVVVWFDAQAPGSSYMAWRLVAILLMSSALATTMAGRDLSISLQRRTPLSLVPFVFRSALHRLTVSMQIEPGRTSSKDHLDRGSFISTLGTRAPKMKPVTNLGSIRERIWE